MKTCRNSELSGKRRAINSTDSRQILIVLKRKKRLILTEKALSMFSLLYQEILPFPLHGRKVRQNQRILSRRLLSCGRRAVTETARWPLHFIMQGLRYGMSP